MGRYQSLKDGKFGGRREELFSQFLSDLVEYIELNDFKSKTTLDNDGVE